MLTIKNLTKTYDDHIVVDDLNFHVKRGEVFALLGANGAGKTTTIKMILGLTKPTAGTIDLSETVVGYSQESPYFPPYLSGREVLEYYGALQGFQKSKRQLEATEKLELVGLQDRKTKVKNYSKGMLQRLSVAQALLGDPAFMILDEPTAGMDAVGRVEILHLLAYLKKQGKTMIINSHNLEDIERVCDRGILMNRGVVYRDWNKVADSGKALEDIFLETMGEIK